MKKSINFLVKCMILFVCLFIGRVSAQTIWNGSTDITWYEASGTHFIISTPEELAGLALIVNSGITSFTNDTISLANDIWLNSDGSNANYWVPIGGSASATSEDAYSGNSFKGTFDGNEHTIYNLYCDKTGYFHAGLFGKVAQATIKHVALMNPTVISRGMMGALVGFTYSGGAVNIIDCIIMNATVTGINANGNNNIGGILGANYSNTSGTYITSCGVTGDISGNYVGGLGGNAQYAYFTNCYFAGTVTTYNNQSGGIASYQGTCNNVYSNYSGSGTNGTIKTIAEMQDEDFVDDLDSTFRVDCGLNGGFPLKTWQPCGANISGNLLICAGESTTLTAQGYVSYLWSTGATTASITVSPTVTTTYTITVTDAFNSQLQDSVTVTVYPQAEITAMVMPSYDGIVHGTVTPDTAYVGCGSSSTVTLTITPDEDWHIVQIIVNDSVVREEDPTDGGMVQYTIDPQGTLCNVRIILDNHYTITTTIYDIVGNLLSIYNLVSPSGNQGVVTVTAGSDTTYHFNETGRYHLVSVNVDGAIEDLITSYDFFNIQENHTITVVYEDACGISELPMTENFDSYNASWIKPDCWTCYNTFSPTSNYPGTYAYYHYSEPNGLYFMSNATAFSVAALPVLDSTFNIADLQLSFNVYTGSTENSFVVGVMTDPNNIQTFEALDTVHVDAAWTWQNVTIYLANYTGYGRYIAIKKCAVYSMGIIDDVVLDYAPFCTPVRLLQVLNSAYNNNTDGYATLSWLPNTSGAVSYTVEYAPMDSENWLSIETIDTFCTITGLNSYTEYQVRVKANCSPLLSSDYEYTSFELTCDSADRCQYVVNFSSSFAYGWAYNSITVMLDGEEYSTITGQDYGSTVYLEFCDNRQVSFIFNRGNYWTDYFNFTISDPFGNILVSTNGGTLNDQEVILSLTTNCTAPTCNKPQFISFSNFTNHSVEVSWQDTTQTAQGVFLVYGFHGFLRDTGMVQYADYSPYILSNLLPYTEYDLYVRSYCSVGDTSYWTLVQTFTTDCEAIDSLPYIENFDGNNMPTIADAIPTCWNRATSDAGHFVYYNGNSGNAHSGTGVLDFHYTLSYWDMGIMPPISSEIAMNDLMVTLWARAGSLTTVFEVGVLANTSDYSTFTPIDTLTPSAINTWNEYLIPLSSYIGEGRYIAFRCSNGDYSSYLLDDISIDYIPSCITPNDVQLVSKTNTSATISWVERGNATNWILEYDTAGFTPGNASFIVNVSTNPFELTNLQQGYSYNVYVKAQCSSNEQSDYSEPLTFSTEVCDSIDQCNYTFHLHSNSSPYGQNYWVHAGASIDIYSNDIFITTLTLPSGIFDQDFIIPLCDNSIIEVVYNGTSISYHNQCSFSIADPAHTVLYSCSDASTLILGSVCYNDTLSCTASESCLTPLNPLVTNVTENSAHLSWSASGDETQWIVEYKTFAANTYNSVTVNNTPSLTLNNLQSATNYEARLKAVCSETLESDFTENFYFITDSANITYYTIEATASVGGTITPSGTISIAQGEDISFEIIPNENYLIMDLLVDGNSVLNNLVNSIYILENVIANHTIHADFTSVSIESYHANSDVIIYPNPVTQNLTISTAIQTQNLMTQITIVDLLGRKQFEAPVGVSTITLNVQDYAPGIYFVTVLLNNGEKITRKLIKQ